MDIAPWAYAWRAGLATQEQPEAYFIPRRFERMNKVYRTAFTALPQQQVEEHILYDMPDLLKPLLPPPKGQLQAGLLWTAKVVDYRSNCTGRRMFRQIPRRKRWRLGLSYLVRLVWVDRG